jgi:transcriptional regulator with AAA-type ATPase domain
MKDYIVLCVRRWMKFDGFTTTTYPFETRGKAGTTATAEAGCLDLSNNPIMTLQDNLLGLVPIAHLLRAGEIGRVSSVEVLEDSVLVLEATVRALRSAILDGCQAPHGGP